MSESLYDKEIAPKLMELAKLCETNGIPFLACVEWEPGQVGRTEFMPDTATLSIQLPTFAARCDNNVDALFITISRYCQRKGIDTSRSFVMEKFGTPSTRTEP